MGITPDTSNPPHDSKHRHAELRYGKRLCVSCRNYHSPQVLIRVTKTKQGRWYTNPPTNIQGRSAYCCKNQSCIQQALRQRRFSKALKSAMPDGIVVDLNSLLQCVISQSCQVGKAHI